MARTGADGAREGGGTPDAPRWLRTKLHPPAPCTDLVPRPRLVERLEDPGTPVVLVAAPAGSGKTTLLAEWLTWTTTPIAWLSLDPLDNDLRRFLVHLAAALDSVVPGLASAIVAEITSPDPPPAESTISDLIDALDRGAPEQAALADGSPSIRLVLDDLHTVESPEVHRAVAFLIENRTPRLGVVLSARATPPLPIERWRLGGQLTEIGDRDLRFDAPELRTLLCERHGYRVPDAVLASFARRTEGWIAGIRLACHSIDDPAEAEDRLARFSGEDRYVLDYLLEEVLDRMAPVTRAFVLETSILDTLSGELCDAVTGGSGGQLVLEELERSNLFTVALDRERQWFRYHHLFADLLRSREGATAEEDRARRHVRASEWFEEAGRREEALQHAIAARDWDRTERLLEPILDDILGRGERRNALHWLPRIPERVRRERPRLLLGEAWAQFTYGNLDEGRVATDRAERALRGSGDEVSRAEVEVLRGFHARFRGDVDEVLEHVERALESLPPGELRIRSEALLLRGAALRLAGRLPEAIVPLEDAVRLGRRAGCGYIAFGAMNTLANVESQLGHLHRGAERFRSVIEETAPDRPLHVIESHVALGGILREWGRLDEAEEHLLGGIEIAERRGVEHYWPHAHFHRARIHRVRGRADRALESMEHAVELAQRSGYARSVRQARAERARLQLLSGDVHGPLEWFRTDAVERDEEPSALTLFEGLVRVRMLRAIGRHADARAESSRQIARAERLALHGDRIEAHLLASGLVEPRERDEHLRAALSLAESSGHCQVFIEEGEGLAAALTAATLPESLDAARTRVLREFGTAGTAVGAVEELSDRETEVLRKIADGCSNEEVGRALFVSPNTVKTHLRKIFRKLGVHSRTQAIAAARERRLLGD